MAAKRQQRPSSKRCSRCQETKPLSDFPRNAATADGLAAYCRGCKRTAERERRSANSTPAKVEAPKAAKASRPKAPTTEVLAAAPRARPGPPSTITADIIEALCEPLRAGHTRRVAASKAGVNEDTLAVWMLKGREAKDPTAPTRQLYEAVKAAEGIGLMSLEEKAIAGAEIDHVQALRILERRHPEAWARRELKAEGTDSQHMEADDVRKLLTERLARFLGDAPPSATPSPGGPDAGAASSAGGGAA